MSRGRKPKSKLNGSEWEQIFDKSQGFYFQYIIIQLGRKNKKLSEDDANDLVEIIKQEKEKLVAEKKISKEKPLPEIKAEESPFKIPDNWSWCRLGKIITMIYGSGLTKAQTTPNAKFPVFGSNGIVGYYDEYLTDKRAVIIGRKGSSGALNISEKPSWATDVAYYVEETKNIDFTFLYFLLKSLSLDKLGKGIKPGLSRSEAYHLAVAIPPLCEQKMIADFLHDFGKNTLDENREYFNLEIENEVVSLHQAQIYNSQISTELNHQLALVKELRQAYLREAMQGKLALQNSADGPVEMLFEKIKAEKEKLVAEKKIKRDKPLPPIKPEEIPFEIPSNWIWCRLGEICTKIGSGSTPKGSNYSKNGIAFFRSQNIYDEGLILEDITFISDDVHKQMNGTTVKANDILLNITGGSLGRAALVPKDFTEGNVSQHVCIIRPICIDNSFLHKAVLSPYFQYLIFDSTTGAGREGLPKYNLEQFLTPIPPFAEQKRIVEKLERLMSLCDELEATIKQSKANAGSLLQTALKEALQQPISQAA